MDGLLAAAQSLHLHGGSALHSGETCVGVRHLQTLVLGQSLFQPKTGGFKTTLQVGGLELLSVVVGELLSLAVASSFRLLESARLTAYCCCIQVSLGLDLVENIPQFIFLEYFIFELFEYGEYELVEEDPLVLEEATEEGTHFL